MVQTININNMQHLRTLGFVSFTLYMLEYTFILYLSHTQEHQWGNTYCSLTHIAGFIASICLIDL